MVRENKLHWSNIFFPLSLFFFFSFSSVSEGSLSKATSGANIRPGNFTGTNRIRHVTSFAFWWESSVWFPWASLRFRLRFGSGTHMAVRPNLPLWGKAHFRCLSIWNVLFSTAEKCSATQDGKNSGRFAVLLEDSTCKQHQTLEVFTALLLGVVEFKARSSDGPRCFSPIDVILCFTAVLVALLLRASMINGIRSWNRSLW